MAVNRERDRKGKLRIVVSKRWPDGSRFRRYVPNSTIAKKTLARVEEAIAMGTWRQLKEELGHKKWERSLTVADFAKIYFDDYCKIHNTRPDYKDHALKPIIRILGGVPLTELRRQHAHQFIVKRSREVSAATVNRSLQVLKNMFTFAVEGEYVESHPLRCFHKLPEEQKALRVMTLEEERRLVESVSDVDHTVGAYVAVLGETGLRKSEGLNLKWSHVNFQQRILSVEDTKSGKPRYVGLSEYGVEWLSSLVRLMDSPYVFARLDSRDRWRKPDGPFKRGAKAAGLGWVGFHDLRHFRATQWVMRGVDLRTVKELLGHADIQTTMRYAHFAPSHAAQSIFEAQKAEAAEIAQLRAKSGRQSGVEC